MSCTVDTKTTHASVGSGALAIDVQYVFGPDVASAASILTVAGATYRMHKLTGSSSISTIGQPSPGDGSSRIVTFYTQSGSPTVPVVFRHLAGGGLNNISLRDGIDLGLYPGESITFAYVNNTGIWVEITRNTKMVIASATNSSGSTGVASGSEGAPAATVITLPSVTFDGTTPMRVTFYCGQGGTTDSGTGFLGLYQDGTSTGFVYEANSAANGTNNGFTALNVDYHFVPPSGAHTYAFKAWATLGSSSYFAGAGGLGNLVPIQASIRRYL